MRLKIVAVGLAVLLMGWGCGKKDEGMEPLEESAEVSGQTDESAAPAVTEENSSADETGEEKSASASASPAEGGEAGDKVNINSADLSTLMSVPGIGEKMAADIIAFREEHGKFKSIDQLKGSIKGIGEKKFDKMSPHLTVEGGMSHGSVDAAESKSESQSSKSGGRSSKKAPPSAPVNLNTATAEQLQTIPGIGEKKAEEIIAWRKANGDFKAIEDLRKIKGIGEKKFEKMKPYITVK